MTNLLEDFDFGNAYVVGSLFLMLSIIIFFRYLLVSGIYHVLFFKLFRKKYKTRFLRKKPLKNKQLLKEIYWSGLSGIIFAATGIFIYYLYTKGYASIYLEISKFPIWYIPISVFIFLFAQDTYYYWLHRWMHLPNVYKYFHLVHHKSVHTSVLTSFSFHPLETIAQAVFLPVALLFLPLHLYALLTVLLIMTISATINHAGVEIYPSGKISKWIIGATHHDFHHRTFNYNYGLYFTFWDKVMKTELEENSK